MHTFVHAGVKLGKWNLIGKSSDLGSLDVYFRDSHDYGFFPHQKIVSYNWTIWKMNGERIKVGKLPKKYYNAYIGMVYHPESVLYRIENREYPEKFYPDYK